MAKKSYLALDLGAGSGRAMLGVLDNGKLDLQEVHRFKTSVMKLESGLYWDINSLFDNITLGIKKAGETARQRNLEFISVGVDTWGVDYALIGKEGQLVCCPRNYRDERNPSAMEKLVKQIGREKIYSITGVQFMPINTLYQLFAHKEMDPGALARTSRVLMMPDLMHYFLSGKMANEMTIASTSQMLDARNSISWSDELINRAGLPREAFGNLIYPGTFLGNIKPEIADKAGVSHDLKIIVPATHDTACAVAAIPAVPGSSWCYISSGTWSLFGAEIDKPVTSQRAFETGFSNEIGINGTTRLLKNIQAMWFFQQCMEFYSAENSTPSNCKLMGAEGYNWLIEQARIKDPFRTIIDPDSPRFSQHGDMPAKIQRYALDSNQEVPRDKGEVIRACGESLALAYRSALEDLEFILGREFEVIHIGGGGAYNKMVNQMTADATGRKVITGPYEASSTGNVLTQAMGAGDVKDINEIRQIVSRSFGTEVYTPSGKKSDWDSSYGLYKSLVRKRDVLTK